MSLQTRLQDLTTALGTDYKTIKGWVGDLASLTTANKTSLVAAINELKASSANVSAASETVAGIAEIATQAETDTGTDDLRIVTPLKLKVAGDARYQPKNSNLTALAGYTVSSSQSLGTSDTVLPTQAAVKAYADGLIAAADAMVYKGVIDASTNPNYPASNRGDTYRISVAGKIGGASGPNVEVNDILMALTDGTASGTHAAVGAQWNITQANLDGAVVGPTTSVSGDFATFSGTSGKVVQDSGLSLDIDGTMAANSDSKLPSQKAVRTYVAATAYSKTEIGNPETDLVAAYTTAKA